LKFGFRFGVHGSRRISIITLIGPAKLAGCEGADMSLSMLDASQLAKLRQRVLRCHDALQNFIRIQEEMLSIRKRTPIGEYRDRVDAMLRTYKSTVVTMRESLKLAEEELERAALRPR
jgi:hypothetical protein